MEEKKELLFLSASEEHYVGNKEALTNVILFDSKLLPEGGKKATLHVQSIFSLKDFNHRI